MAGARRRSKLFISYSHKDRPWLDQLLEHLRGLVREQDIDWWADVRIQPGDDWQAQIEAAIASARAAIFLLSRHFVASDFIHERELQPLLAAAEREGLRILPVYLSPCLVPTALERFQGLNPPERTLVDMGEGERERVWVRLGTELRAHFGSAPAASDDSEDPLDRLVGTLVSGRYRVARKLGGGSMSRVFEAVDEDLGRRVALKVLRSELARAPEQVERLWREALAANTVDHPGVISITDRGQLPGGSPYLVMEYVAGELLGERLGRGALGPGTLELAWQLALVLGAVHKKGIVHRDLKPDNVMLVRDPVARGGERVKVLDFGIAKLAEEQYGSLVERLTVHEHTVLGTPLYMAPEQAEDARAVTDRADVYSLGAMLYQMVAGRPPFHGGKPIHILHQHLHQAPPPLGGLVPSVDPELAKLVHRMLAKKPDERPAMTEVMGWLAVLRERGAIRAQARHLVAAAGGEPRGVTAVQQAQASAPILASSAPKRAVGLGALALVLLALLGWGVVHWVRGGARTQGGLAQDAGMGGGAIRDAGARGVDAARVEAAVDAAVPREAAAVKALPPPLPGMVRVAGGRLKTLDEVATFDLDEAVVTVAQYRACVKAGRCRRPGTGGNCRWGRKGRDIDPINCVEVSQESAYCRWQGKRLPTDVEWAYALQAGARYLGQAEGLRCARTPE